eukprot:gb/GECG01013680.1/.p1 GENE.gb/GECG01013680.1/~~gb/GECG01013680.1/.p1  ORF type:complete len:1396 (+),score=187.77 gb/GECG01013680.1/:1-4188(+)
MSASSSEEESDFGREESLLSQAFKRPNKPIPSPYTTKSQTNGHTSSRKTSQMRAPSTRNGRKQSVSSSSASSSVSPRAKQSPQKAITSRSKATKASSKSDTESVTSSTRYRRATRSRAGEIIPGQSPRESVKVEDTPTITHNGRHKANSKAKSPSLRRKKIPQQVAKPAMDMTPSIAQTRSTRRGTRSVKSDPKDTTSSGTEDTASKKASRRVKSETPLSNSSLTSSATEPKRPSTRKQQRVDLPRDSLTNSSSTSSTTEPSLSTTGPRRPPPRRQQQRHLPRDSLTNSSSTSSTRRPSTRQQQQRDLPRDSLTNSSSTSSTTEPRQQSTRRQQQQDLPQESGEDSTVSAAAHYRNGNMTQPQKKKRHPQASSSSSSSFASAQRSPASPGLRSQKSYGVPLSKSLKLNKSQREKYAGIIKCSVCSEGEDSDNPLKQCSGCGMRLHPECYGERDMHPANELDTNEQLFQGDFACSACVHRLGEGEVRCVLCPNISNRAMKELADNEPVRGWVHVACALWTPNIYFNNPEDLKEPAGLRFVAEERWELKCEICTDKRTEFKGCLRESSEGKRVSELRGITKSKDKKTWELSLPRSITAKLATEVKSYSDPFEAAIAYDEQFMRHYGISDDMNFPGAFSLICDTIRYDETVTSVSRSKKAAKSIKSKAEQSSDSQQRGKDKRKKTFDGWTPSKLTDAQLRAYVKAGTGAPIQCSTSSCAVAFHVTCAMRAGWEFSVLERKSGEVSKRAFCSQHSTVLVVDEDEPCRECGSREEPDRMLLCEHCGSVFHLECLDPPLDRIPSGKWFCRECLPELVQKGSVIPSDGQQNTGRNHEVEGSCKEYITLDEEYVSSLPAPPALMSSDESDAEDLGESDSDDEREIAPSSSSAAAASSTGRVNFVGEKRSNRDMLPKSVSTSHFNDFFAANRSKQQRVSSTSSANLEDIGLPEPQEAKRNLIQHRPKNAQDRTSLMFIHIRDFCRTRLMLLEGYNVIFYGVGSKIKLLDLFIEYLSRGNTNLLICSGYNPLTSIDELIRLIWEKFVRKECPSHDPVECCHELLNILGKKFIENKADNSSLKDSVFRESWGVDNGGKVRSSTGVTAKDLVDIWPRFTVSEERSGLSGGVDSSSIAGFHSRACLASERLTVQSSRKHPSEEVPTVRNDRYSENAILSDLAGCSLSDEQSTMPDSGSSVASTSAPKHRRTRRGHSQSDGFPTDDAGDKDHLFIALHNIDGSSFQNSSARTALFLLSQCTKIHFIASVDHINAALLQDQQQRLLGNWVWLDGTTFEPYVKETVHTAPVMDKQQNLSHAGVQHVLQSLTPTHVEVLKILAQHQREHDSGMAKTEWYDACFDNLLLTNETTFRGYLGEFTDHELVVTKGTENGGIMCTLPDNVFAELPVE